jgi:hypothetical protein
MKINKLLSFRISMCLCAALWVLATLIACGGDDETETCSDNIRNQDEVGIDCGGVCNACVAATCADNEQNGDEADVDCGGETCAPCITESCTDRAQNGQETGIDCGGPDCPACVAATCEDGVQNGNETGEDCGGDACDACPTCSDATQNGDETGVDCGGDCVACDTGAATCSDGILNGDESGIDCGGTCTTVCELAAGDNCSRGNDLCEGDNGEDVACTFAEEIDPGSADIGVCRERGCTENTDDCEAGARCVTVQEITGENAYTLTDNPNITSDATTLCIAAPAPDSLWQLNVDSVVVDSDFGGFETPDILVCFGPPDSHNNNLYWEDMHCVYDTDQYDAYSASAIGSVTYRYDELELLGVFVLDDDWVNGFSGFPRADVAADDEIANGAFDLRPGGDVREGKLHTLFGTGASFEEDYGLVSIQVSITPATTDL